MIRTIILGALMLFFVSTSFAGHEKGGVIITYKSTAFVNGNQLQYLVEAYAMFDAQGIPGPLSIQVALNSSCFPSSNITLPRIGGVSPVNSADYCTPGTNISGTTNIALYRDTVVLPGVCSDFVFSYSGGFGRFNNTANIMNSFNTSYFSTSLNNTLGPNSSPNLPITDYIQGLCVNQPLVLYGFSESDGDSLYISPATPQYISGSTVSNLSYNAGYSQANQVNSNVGFLVNPNNGVIQTTLSAQGSFLITLNVKEYRSDTMGLPVLVGENLFSMIAIGASNCLVPPAKIKLRSIPNSNAVACGAQTLQLAVNRRLATTTVEPNGSDFQVFNQTGPIPVIGAIALSDSIIQLQLGSPIPGGMDLYVIADTGSDGNVMITVCGNHLAALADTLTFTPQGSGAPQASFSYTESFLQVNFNATTSTADSLLWDFGDASPAISGIMPIHTYAAAGTYSVLLRAFDDCGGEDSLLQSVTICDSLLGSFMSSFSGDTLVLNASVTGATQISWDLGDGTQSAGVQVKHVYANPGQYYVQMTAINLCGDTLVTGDTLNTCPTPISAWTYAIRSTGGSGMVVDFDGTASVGASSWLWDFGDAGATNTTSLTPTHTYITPGLNYLVSLSVTNGCGETMAYAYRLSEIGLLELETSLKIYPNPASELLHIEFQGPLAEPVLLELLNTEGKLVLTRSIEEANAKRLAVPVSHFPAGVYILRMSQGSRASHYQLILE